MKSDTEFKVGDVVYWAETEDANLSHQPDGIGLFRGNVKEDEDNPGRLVVFYDDLEYHVGKRTYAKSGNGFDPLDRNVRFDLYGFIQNMNRKIFKELGSAQKDMIIQIFGKKEWL